LSSRALAPAGSLATRPIEKVGLVTHSAKKLGCAALLSVVVAGACTTDLNVNSNPALPDDAPRIVVETSLGNIVIGLYEEIAPITVANFLAYVDAGFFDGTVFHRVMEGYMVQGGGYVHRNGQYVAKDTLPPIVLESDKGLKNLRGTVSMARMDVPPDSATSQFFINLVNNQRYDRLGEVELGYAVFGVVLEGMDVVDAIAAVETEFRPPFREPAIPVEDVVIRSVRRLS
jgi:cyclophilin family peptidyl-prolyl cis-trans isomerase